MQAPQRGDLLLRGSADTAFELCDAVTLKRIAGPFSSMAEALDVARSLEPAALWQQCTDNRGRVLSDMWHVPQADER